MSTPSDLHDIVKQFVANYNIFYHRYLNYTKELNRFTIGKSIRNLSVSIENFYNASKNLRVAYSIDVNSKAKECIRHVLENIYSIRGKIDPSGLIRPKSSDTSEWYGFLKELKSRGGDESSIQDMKKAFDDFIEAAYSSTNLKFLKVHPNDFWDVFNTVENFSGFRKHEAYQLGDQRKIEEIFTTIKEDFENAIKNKGSIIYNDEEIYVHFSKNVIEAYNGLIDFLQSDQTGIHKNDSFEKQTELKNTTKKLLEYFGKKISTNSSEWKTNTINKIKEAIQLFVVQPRRVNLLPYKVSMGEDFTATTSLQTGLQDIDAVNQYIIGAETDVGALNSAFTNMFDTYLQKIGAIGTEEGKAFAKRSGPYSDKAVKFVNKILARNNLNPESPPKKVREIDPG